MNRGIARSAFALWAAFTLAAHSKCAAGDVARGIYALGPATDNPVTRADERLSRIRTYDFVSGYTLRVLWKDIEPAQDQYNFSVIDSAVSTLAGLGLGLKLDVVTTDEPQYVLDNASATYIDHRGEISPVPWDAFAQDRHAALFAALASHIVPAPGGPHPLNVDPTLRSIDTAPAGLNYGVRDLNSAIRSHPEYTQARYVDAVVRGVQDVASQFPTDTNTLAFFGFDDGQPGTPVDEQILERLAPLYNGAGQTRLDFFVENLSDNWPAPLTNGTGCGNNLLDWASYGGSSSMQALDSWLIHPIEREPQLASHNPGTGINLANSTFGTRMFELYVSDLDGAANGALDLAGKPLLADLEYWAGRLTVADIQGDYNGDGSVDGSDYVMWRKLEGSAARLQNDATAGVDASDYYCWRANFGQPANAANSGSTSSLQTGVPEPATAWLLVAAIARLFFARRGVRRCHRYGSHPAVFLQV